MNINAARRALFEQLVEDIDAFVDDMVARSGDRFASTESDKSALKTASFNAMVGFVHSMFVNIDGGGPLADTARVDLVTAGGESLGPALHELFFEYLAEIDRLPA